MGTKFFLLADGEVRIVVNGSEVATLSSGAFFGEQSLLKAQPRNADVVAVGECLVLMMTRKDFLAVRHRIKARPCRDCTLPSHHALIPRARQCY